MKKHTLLTLFQIVFFMSGSSLAQSGFTLQFLIEPQINGIKGDFNVPNLSSSYVPLEKKSTIGFSGAITLGYNLSENIGISVGCMYSHQGQKYNDYYVSNFYETFTVDRKVNLNYLKLPVQLNFNTSTENSVSFAAFAGFYLGFPLSYKDEVYSTDYYDDLSGNSGLYTYSISTTGTTANINGSFNGDLLNENYTLSAKPYKGDFGATLGGGFQFNLSDYLAMPLMINYQIGIADIKNKTTRVQDPSGTNLFWNYWSVSDKNASIAYHNSCLGILIGLKIIL